MQNPFQDGVSVEINGDSSGLEGAVNNAVSSLGSLKKAAGVAGAAVAGLAVAGLSKAAGAAMDFEEALVEVEKVTDPETAEAMSDSIMEMAETIPLAQDELAGLTADAARFGIRGQENLEAFVQSTAKLATATDLNTQQAGESMAKLAELTNTPISEVENLGSSINTLANTSATSSQEIVDAMLRSSGELSNLGLQQTEIASLSASLNSVSESSERAGSRLRRMAQEMMDPNKVEDLSGALGMTSDEFVTMRDESPNELIMTMAEAMAEGGDSADDLRDSLSTVSQQALTGLGSNLEGTREAMDTANESFDEGKSLQEEFDSATDTTNSKLEIAKNRLRGIGITIGEQVLPPITKFLEFANDAIEDIAALNEKTDGAIGKFTLVGGAIAGAGVALATFVGGPLTVAIGAIALFASAWVNGWDETKAAISEGVDFATRAFREIGDWLRENGPGLVEEAVTILKDMVRDGATWIQENGPPLIKEGFRLIGRGIRFVVKDIYNGITGNGDSLIKSIILDAASWIKNNGPGLLKTAIGFVIDVIWAAFTGLYEGLIGNSLVKDIFNDISEYIKTTAKESISGAIDTLIEGAKTAFNYLTGTGNGTLVSDIKGAAESAIDGFKEKFNLVGAVENAIDAAQRKISSWTPDWPDLSPPSVSGGGGDDDDDDGGIVDKGKDLIGLDTGGYIKDGGIARLHAGERVIPERDVERGGIDGGPTVNIGKIEASGYQEGREAARGLKQELDSHGV